MNNSISLYVGISNIVALPLALSHSLQYDNAGNIIEKIINIHILFFIAGINIEYN